MKLWAQSLKGTTRIRDRAQSLTRHPLTTACQLTGVFLNHLTVPCANHTAITIWCELTGFFCLLLGIYIYLQMSHQRVVAVHTYIHSYHQLM